MARYPANLIIRPLMPAEWERVAGTYCEVTENAMPDNPFQSVFYGVFLGDELVGFAHLEQFFHLNAVYLKKEYRKRGFFRAILDTISDQIPKGFPVVILPDRQTERLLVKRRFRFLGKIAVWRRDF